MLPPHAQAIVDELLALAPAELTPEQQHAIRALARTAPRPQQAAPAA